MFSEKKFLFKYSRYLCFTLILSLTQGASAQTLLTDYMSMENGNAGDVVTSALAASATTGTSGVWSNANSSPSCPTTTTSGCTLKVSSAHVRPPRGDIKIGSTVLPNTGSTKSYVKKITNETDQEYVDYIFNNPRPKKVSVGMFVYFSSDGDGWNGSWSDYYDLFTLTGNGGDNYLVLSVQTTGGSDGTPLNLTLHTDVPPCNSGVHVADGTMDKWYWVTMLYDYSGSNRKSYMQIYDATTWTKLGQNACDQPSKPDASRNLWRVSVGQYDNHGNPTHNSDYYSDDLMIYAYNDADIASHTSDDPYCATTSASCPGADPHFPLLPKIISGGGTTPSAPSNLRVLP